MTKVILHDQLTALLLPFLSDDETLFFPAYNGGDVWHTLHMGAELRLSTCEGKPEAEIYYVVGRTPKFKRIQVEDKRTKPEPEPEPETIERGIRRVVIEHNVKQIGNTSNKFPPRILPAKSFGDDFDKYEGLTLQHEEGRRDGVWVLYSQTFLYTKKSDEQLLKEFN
jgi:hypothetical protein